MQSKFRVSSYNSNLDTEKVKFGLPRTTACVNSIEAMAR